MTKPTVGIVGAGRLGGALGLILRDRGYPLVGVKNSTPESTAKAAALLGASAFDDVGELGRRSEVLLVTVRDELISQIAQEIAGAKGFWSGQVVIHTSGSQPAGILGPAKDFGAYVLSLHPLQSSPTPEQGRRNLPEAVFSIEGDREVFPVAEQLVRDIGASFFHIDASAKPLYHAAACAASNYLVTLLDLARTLLVRAGLPPELFVKSLYPLIQGTLNNVASLGIPEALTGPISRGDATTIAGHLQSMRERAKELVPLYCLLGTYTVEVALRKGTIGEAEARRLRALLQERGPEDAAHS